jgi:hypothetical protein
MLNEKLQKVAKTFCCEKCEYITIRKSSFSKHLLTLKHESLTSVNKNKVAKVAKVAKTPKMANTSNSNVSQHVCAKCSKTYKSRVGLWYHLKKCDKLPQLTESDINVMDNDSLKNSTVLEIVKQNQEFKELIVGLIKDKNNTIINNTTNTNHNNNQFNLNFFLNEQCKDALNMDEFLNTIVIQLTDLENSLALGYSDGLSKIIVTGLNALDLHKRPIHCSDLKRETLYIKEGNIWEKDNEDRKKIKRVICAVERKTIGKLAEWPKSHPNSLIGSHQDNTTYMKIVRQVSGGDLEKAEMNLNKIIKNIAQEVKIGKN